MNFSTNKILIAGALIAGLSFGIYKFAFSSSCCAAETATTSGCTPSNCRGATTKFGEAKVITDLRLNLIDLKAEMEKSESPTFDANSYDIHGIVGDTDEESLAIVVKEVKKVEDAFVKELNYQVVEFSLPDNKAKQVAYLDSRIEELKSLL